MAPKQYHGQIKQEDFEAFDKAVGHNCTVLARRQHHHLYHRNEVPLKKVPSPYIFYRTTEVSEVPGWPFPAPLHPATTRGFLFGHLSPMKQQVPPARIGKMREYSPMGPHQVQEQYLQNGPVGRVPASKTGAIDNFKAARMYGGTTSIDYGQFD